MGSSTGLTCVIEAKCRRLPSVILLQCLPAAAAFGAPPRSDRSAPRECITPGASWLRPGAATAGPPRFSIHALGRAPKAIHTAILTAPLGIPVLETRVETREIFQDEAWHLESRSWVRASREAS